MPKGTLNYIQVPATDLELACRPATEADQPLFCRAGPRFESGSRSGGGTNGDSEENGHRLAGALLRLARCRGRRFPVRCARGMLSWPGRLGMLTQLRAR
jgi:hypothetical protein